MNLKGSKTKELWQNPEYREHMRKAHLGHQKPPNAYSFSKGLVINEEWKEKIRLSKLGEKNPMFGSFKEKNPAWLGGKSFESYSKDQTNTLKQAIRERDGYTCQICGKTKSKLKNNINRLLDVHHIDYDKNNSNTDNLITLCMHCHLKTNIDREYWIEYFSSKRKEVQRI